jgi:hypothetical protein
MTLLTLTSGVIEEARHMLSQRSIETLIDLAENKLSQIIPFDRDDVREIKLLHSCVDELKSGGGASVPVGGRRTARIENQAATH